MNRTRRPLVAAAVAATLAAGALLAPPASAATTAGETPLVFDAFLSYKSVDLDRSLRLTATSSTYAGGVATADPGWTLPAVGETGQIRSRTGACLFVSTGSDTAVRYTPCSALPAGSENRFTVTPEGRIETASFVLANYSNGRYQFLGRSAKSQNGLRLVGPHTGVGLTALAVSSTVQNPSGSLTLTGSATPGSEIRIGSQSTSVTGDGTTGPWSLTVPLTSTTVVIEQWVGVGQGRLQRYDAQTIEVGMTATLDTVDVATRTATLSGTARTDSVVIVDGDRVVEVDAQGRWATDVSGLSIGSNTIHLEEYVGTSKTSEAMVEAVVEVASVTARAVFASRVTTPVTVTGTAHPGATVQLTSGGTVVADALADPHRGSWSTTLTAPDLPGVYPVRVSQLVDGERNGDVPLDIDYGRGVVVTSPVDFTIVDPGPLTIRGQGQPGAQITVGERDAIGFVGSATVLPNGTWNLQTSSLDKREHVLDVRQTAPGANTTRAELTINPGDVPIAPTDATVTAPDGYVAGKVNRVTGTATPGSSIRITNPWGTEIARDVAVGRDGRWHFDRAFSGSSVISFHFTQTLADGRVHENGPVLFGPAPSAFRVLTPEPGDGYVSGRATTFTGVAVPGSVVSMTNKWGTSLAPDVVAGPDGRWSVTRVMTGTSIYQIHFIERVGTTTTTVTFYDFRPRV